MADEIEIKFRVSPEVLDSVQHLRGLGICGPLKRQNLRSVYFDTSNGKLRKKGLTLRVRHAGNTRLQTVKSEAESAFARGEWECEIESDLPDLAKLDDTPLARLKKPNLIPVFETVVTRTTMPVRTADSEFEIALDRGHIAANRRRQPVSEIEIELKRGNAADVVQLAQRLMRKIDGSYEVRSKSERGYALADGREPVESGARDLPLHPQITTTEAFQEIGMECLRHIVANEAAVRAENPEGIHQMRVGLRRLRAAMSLFKQMLTDRESTAVKTELKWLTEQLGPARDFDVFVRDSVAPLEKAASEITLLRRDLEGRRDDGFEQACAAVAGERYRKLVLKVLFWLHSGAWSTTEDDLVAAQRQRPVAEFAREELDRRLKKIVRRACKVKDLEPYKRHKLRIAIKKLRYAGEFCAALFKGSRHRAAMTAALEELQDALGRLNDIAVHRRMTGDIVRPPKRQQKAFAMGLVTAREDAGVKACLSVARKAGRRLRTVKPFWR